MYSCCLITGHAHLVIDPSDVLSHVQDSRNESPGGRRGTRIKLTGDPAVVGKAVFNRPLSQLQITCQRVIVIWNPLRAGMVSAPQDCKWASCRCKAERRDDQIVDSDTANLSLRKTKRDHQTACIQYV